MRTLKTGIILTVFLTSLLFFGCNRTEQPELPNILWITSEDNSPLLGCYGDEFATTPNLDNLASEGFLYTHAYANAPVCAPARNTIITGVLACSNGHEQMRSKYLKSDHVHYYTEYLLAKGYYCTNNTKTDYNIKNPPIDQMWNESGREAHYKNRAGGQPFFAIFNIKTSHESSIHRSIPDSLLRHKPEDVTLPPYHPDTPELRHDWAQYYDKVEDMDSRVGDILEELDSLGLADNTIVFYYSDHGGVLARSKRFLYETGTHVPFIIRIPEAYKNLYPAKNPGSAVDRLISFVDLAPTLLSIVDTIVPEYMQGNAFLGEQKTSDPEYVYMFRDRMDERYDMSRSIVNEKYRYIRNYNPNRIYLQPLEYLWYAPSVGSWENAFLNGKCNEVQSICWNPKPPEELYDIENDPWEINNLAKDPDYTRTLIAMRSACLAYGKSILDAGFIPEADRNHRAGDTPIYDYMRSEEVPYNAIFNAAQLAVEADKSSLEEFKVQLKNEDSAIRYWAAMGLLILGEDARAALPDLQMATLDLSYNVATVAAEALYLLGDTDNARKAYLRVLNCNDMMSRTHALNSIDHVGERSEEIVLACVSLLNNYEKLERFQYDVRTIRWLFQKWELDPADYGIEFPW